MMHTHLVFRALGATLILFLLSGPSAAQTAPFDPLSFPEAAAILSSDELKAAMEDYIAGHFPAARKAYLALADKLPVSMSQDLRYRAACCLLFGGSVQDGLQELQTHQERYGNVASGKTFALLRRLECLEKLDSSRVEKLLEAEHLRTIGEYSKARANYAELLSGLSDTGVLEDMRWQMTTLIAEQMLFVRRFDEVSKFVGEQMRSASAAARKSVILEVGDLWCRSTFQDLSKAPAELDRLEEFMARWESIPSGPARLDAEFALLRLNAAFQRLRVGGATLDDAAKRERLADAVAARMRDAFESSAPYPVLRHTVLYHQFQFALFRTSLLDARAAIEAIEADHADSGLLPIVYLQMATVQGTWRNIDLMVHFVNKLESSYAELPESAHGKALLEHHNVTRVDPSQGPAAAGSNRWLPLRILLGINVAILFVVAAFAVFRRKASRT